jgi:hypothetical protein
VALPKNGFLGKKFADPIIKRDMASYPLQLFRTLLGFRNILTKNSVQSAILVL